MEKTLSFTIPIKRENIFQVLKNLDLLFRLNIQWHLKGHNFSDQIEKGKEFNVTLRWEKDDKESIYTVKILEYREGELLEFALIENTKVVKNVSFSLSSQDNNTVINVKESSEDITNREALLELNLWIKSVLNYAMLLQSRSVLAKFWKFFLDKIYLKLSPTGRRLVFLIVISEIFALLFFIFIVLYFILSG